MKRIKKSISIVAILIFFTFLNFSHVFAHPGRTDASGGHRDNQNKSGLGSYHYHCGGHPPHLHNNGGCPYGSKAKPSSSSKPAPTSATKSTRSPTPALCILGVPKTIYVGEGFQVSTNTNDRPSWGSTHKEVAAIDSAGHVRALKGGTTTITAQAPNGAKASKKIEVLEVIAQAVSINSSTITLEEGQIVRLGADLTPYNTSNKSLKWESSNKDIIKVDNLGYAQALKPGKAKVEVSTSNGKQDFIELEVIPVYANSISITYNKDRVMDNKMDIKDSMELGIDILPKNTGDKSITWEISDPDILKIEDNVLIPLKRGSATVTALTSNGVKDSIEVNVTENNLPNVLIFITIAGIILIAILLVRRSAYK